MSVIANGFGIPPQSLQAMEVLTTPARRDVSELFRQGQEFQLVRETKGPECVPSGWQPGRPTRKGGPELVGKMWKVCTTDRVF